MIETPNLERAISKLLSLRSRDRAREELALLCKLADWAMRAGRKSAWHCARTIEPGPHQHPALKETHG